MRNQNVWTDRGLFLLRAILGVVFIMHGGQKAFVYGHDGLTASFAAMGMPWPSLNAFLITAVELGGGIALLTGVATRVAAVFVAFAMGVAVVKVHLAGGFFAPAGFEFPLTLLVANLALVLTGAGRYSIDALVNGRRRHAQDAQASWKVAA